MLHLDDNVEEGITYNSLGDELPSTVKTKIKKELMSWYDCCTDMMFEERNTPLPKSTSIPLKIGEWLNDIIEDDSGSIVTIDMKYLIDNYNALAKLCGARTVEYSPINSHSRNALLVFDLPVEDEPDEFVISSTSKNFSHFPDDKLRLILDYATANNTKGTFNTLINNIVMELGNRR